VTLTLNFQTHSKEGDITEIEIILKRATKLVGKLKNKSQGQIISLKSSYSKIWTGQLRGDMIEVF